MMAFFARRLGTAAFLLFGITLMTFWLSHVVPGDPVAAMLGERGSPEQIARKRQELGLDRPLPEQYLRYLMDLSRLDLGRSLRTRRPVLEDLRDCFPATFELATAALVLSLVLGLSLGVGAALWRDRWPDHLLRLLALAGVSMPVFWLALVALLVFYFWLDLLPPGGRISDYVPAPPRMTGLYLVDSLLAGDAAAFWSSLRHLVLPAFCLGYLTTATLARMVRSQMLEVLEQDYIRTARALGLPRHQILLKYALKNALLPVVTSLGLAYGSLLSGAVLTETIFSWPGLGRYAVGSMLSLDFPALMGVTLLIAVIYLAVNLLVDLLYAAVDPRIRLGGPG
jgi:peptide/nickel transport system permease protein